VVAGFGDEAGGFGEVGAGLVAAAFAQVEAGLGEVGVREVELHAERVAILKDFVEVVLSAAGEEAARNVVKGAARRSPSMAR